MPVQCRLRRLLSIASMMESGLILKARELARSCRVSRRTILRDVKALQEAGMCIQAKAIEGGYYLGVLNPKRPADLTSDEVLAVVLSVDSLCAVETVSLALRTATTKLLRQLDPSARIEARNVIRAYTTLARQVPRSIDTHVFENILTAIRKDVPIRIHAKQDEG
ncbi:MAG TPA: HTH domain-containing protein, partial [Pirellulales bacterium]|nr:HTH domain-containing protein [Pirellulales bacterium]